MIQKIINWFRQAFRTKAQQEEIDKARSANARRLPLPMAFAKYTGNKLCFVWLPVLPESEKWEEGMTLVEVETPYVPGVTISQALAVIEKKAAPIVNRIAELGYTDEVGMYNNQLVLRFKDAEEAMMFKLRLP